MLAVIASPIMNYLYREKEKKGKGKKERREGEKEKISDEGAFFDLIVLSLYLYYCTAILVWWWQHELGWIGGIRGRLGRCWDGII